MKGSVRGVILLVLLGLSGSVARAQATISASSCEFVIECGPPLVGFTTGVGMVATQSVNLGVTPNLPGFSMGLPNGYAVVLTGDLGGNPDMQGQGACVRAGGEILGGSFLGGFDTVYTTPGLHSVTGTVVQCMWTVDPSSPDGLGLTPGPVLFSVTGSFTVLPVGGPQPSPTPVPTPTPSLQATLIDPVESTIASDATGGPSFIRGNAVVNKPDLLLQATVAVGGVAADGVTQVLVKVTGNVPGDTLTLTVMSDQNSPSGSAADDGGLMVVDGDPNNATNTLQVQPVSARDHDNPVAFAVYRAPVEFSRNSQDELLISRSVSIQVQSQNFPGSIIQINVAILRPPVVLVHGLWSSPQVWNNFGSSADGLFSQDPRFSVTVVDYNESLSALISSTNPHYTPNDVQKITASSMGIAFNAPAILKKVINAVDLFRAQNHVAAVQADIVAQSLGGLIVRATRLEQNYLVPVSTTDLDDSLSFGQGPLHKLVTIGTPHLGSPLATQLLQQENDCMRVGLAKFGKKISVASALLTSGQLANGAVGDLDGNSPALASLQQRSNLPSLLPVALIAGKMTPANLAGLSCLHDVRQNPITALKKCAILLGIRRGCGHSSLGHSPLARALTPTGWPRLFGGDSDAIVGVASQLNGSSGLEIPGLIHTPGFEKINFSGPAELDFNSGVSGAVIRLLNERLSGSDYQRITP